MSSHKFICWSIIKPADKQNNSNVIFWLYSSSGPTEVVGQLDTRCLGNKCWLKISHVDSLHVCHNKTQHAGGPWTCLLTCNVIWMMTVPQKDISNLSQSKVKDPMIAYLPLKSCCSSTCCYKHFIYLIPLYQSLFCDLKELLNSEFDFDLTSNL